MSGFRYEPSKPVAVFTALIGAGMLVFGLVQFGKADDGGGKAFLIFWCAGVVAIVSLHLWAAFSTKGSLGTFARVEDRDPSQ
jgi:hypothetical protein